MRYTSEGHSVIVSKSLHRKWRMNFYVFMNALSENTLRISLLNREILRVILSFNDKQISRHFNTFKIAISTTRFLAIFSFLCSISKSSNIFRRLFLYLLYLCLIFLTHIQIRFHAGSSHNGCRSKLTIDRIIGLVQLSGLIPVLIWEQ